MTEKRSMFENLMHRRVLHVAGMYIAALAEALEIWSDADADYIYSVESRSLINSL
jgi:hypothetical protein